MKSLSYKLPSLTALISLAVVAVFFAGLYFLTPRAAAESQIANGQHLITIHDGGKDKSFITSASTLREAFTRAKVPINPADLVEPRLDTELHGSVYDVNVYRAQPVTIIDGATQKRVMSPYRTAKQIVQNADMTLQKEDRTTLSGPADVIRDGAGLTLTIERATPFTLVLYGKSIPSYTMAKTVGGMMSEKNITLQSNDTLSVDRSAPITGGMQVAIWRNGIQTITQPEEIAFDTKQIKDAEREIGYKQVQTLGKNGQKMVTYEITMRDGVEVSRKAIQSVEVTAPVQQVEVVGAKVTNTFSGSFGEALARLRSCEGSYTSNTGNGYYGAYQYDLRTWGNYQGYPNASLAPPAVQDQKVWETYQARGWQPWPSCRIKMGLQDIYR